MSNEVTKKVSTRDLKRVLGFWDLMGTAVGQIIGAGIMSLAGVAIAMTGRSVPIAFILSAVFVVMFSIPMAIISATARFRGGQYSIICSLVGKKWGGFFTIIFVLTNISIAMYALSFADYALAFLPLLNRKLIALTILTLFYILNFFGIDKMAKIQKLIVLTLVIALATFSLFGITKIVPNYFSDNFMPSGIIGILRAAALLTFATGGALAAANLAGEAKNPTKDIPRVIVYSTVVVAVLYGFMSVIAAGVLPVAEVANQPLTWVAKEILPSVLYIFFVVGGAMFALVSTLNSQLAWATKPVMQACVDGWFPKKLAFLYPKYKTPVYLLTIMYVVGLVPIVFNFDIGIIGSIVIIVSQFVNILLALALLGMPKVMPELWNKSKFKTSPGVAKIIVLISVAVSIMQVILLGSDMSLPLLFGNVIIVVVAAVFSMWRYNSGKVDIEESYEDN